MATIPLANPFTKTGRWKNADGKFGSRKRKRKGSKSGSAPKRGKRAAAKRSTAKRTTKRSTAKRTTAKRRVAPKRRVKRGAAKRKSVKRKRKLSTKQLAALARGRAKRKSKARGVRRRRPATVRVTRTTATMRLPAGASSRFLLPAPGETTRMNPRKGKKSRKKGKRKARRNPVPAGMLLAAAANPTKRRKKGKRKARRNPSGGSTTGLKQIRKSVKRLAGRVTKNENSIRHIKTVQQRHSKAVAAIASFRRGRLAAG